MTRRSIVRASRRQLAQMQDLSDARSPCPPGMGPGFWSSARPLYPSRNPRLVRLRLDPEVIDWFARNEAPGETMEAVLRTYVEARKAAPRKP